MTCSKDCARSGTIINQGKSHKLSGIEHFADKIRMCIENEVGPCLLQLSVQYKTFSSKNSRKKIDCRHSQWLLLCAFCIPAKHLFLNAGQEHSRSNLFFKQPRSHNNFILECSIGYYFHGRMSRISSLPQLSNELICRLSLMLWRFVNSRSRFANVKISISNRPTKKFSIENYAKIQNVRSTGAMKLFLWPIENHRFPHKTSVFPI